MLNNKIKRKEDNVFIGLEALEQCKVNINSESKAFVLGWAVRLFEAEAGKSHWLGLPRHSLAGLERAGFANNACLANPKVPIALPGGCWGC